MDYDILVEDILKELEKKLSQSKKLVLIGSLSLNEIELLNKVYTVVPFTDVDAGLSYYAVLVGHITVESMANIAAGCGCTLEDSFILRALLMGKTVYLLESGIEYKKYKEMAHKNLYSFYQSCEKKIIQYGMVPISSSRNLIGEKNSMSLNGPISTEIDFTSKNLLLEGDLLKMNRQDLLQVRIKKNCIITPSAMDFIRNHNVKIIKI